MVEGLYIETETFSTSKNQQLMQLLNKAALAYSHAMNAPERDDVELSRIRTAFIMSFGNLILESISATSRAADILNKEIYSGEITTLLGQIGNVFYRIYIQDRKEPAELIISKKNLDKLNVSPSDIISYTRKISPLVKDFMTVTGYMHGQGMQLEFSLII